MKDNIRTTSLLVITALMSVGLASGASNLGAQSGSVAWKGQPDMLYMSDGDKRKLTSIGNSPESTLTPDNLNLEKYDKDSFQACVTYVELDLRRWDQIGPLDTDCYNYQEFRTLLERGELPPLNSTN